MKVRELMTPNVIRIRPEEPVAVAARNLTHYNIGMLPVCGSDGKLRGVVTDRDLVTRCIAAGRDPQKTKVSQIMSGSVVGIPPDLETEEAAEIMGRRQIRRLPVLEKEKLCGMVSLGDLAVREQSNPDAADALEDISKNISNR